MFPLTARSEYDMQIFRFLFSCVKASQYSFNNVFRIPLYPLTSPLDYITNKFLNTTFSQQKREVNDMNPSLEV